PLGVRRRCGGDDPRPRRDGRTAPAPPRRAHRGAGRFRRACHRRSLMSVLRADARRNLDRILEAASDAFAELGPDVTIDEIARRAGVGHGTVFRRFPTKDALYAAVIRVRLDEMLARAKELLDEPDAR